MNVSPNAAPNASIIDVSHFPCNIGSNLFFASYTGCSGRHQEAQKKV
jgi:hypothetical protein